MSLSVIKVPAMDRDPPLSPLHALRVSRFIVITQEKKVLEFQDNFIWDK